MQQGTGKKCTMFTLQGRQSSCAAAGLPTGRSTVNSHFRTSSSQERQHMEDHSPDVPAHVETSAQLQGGVDVGMHRMWSGFEVSGAASDEECGQGRVFHGFETVLPTPGHLVHCGALLVLTVSLGMLGILRQSVV